MSRRFYETAEMYERRCDLEAAKASIADKRLWRVDAIEMIECKSGGWRMGRKDHFTVEACSAEMAIAVFKYRNDNMSWFVTAVEEETVTG